MRSRAAGGAAGFAIIAFAMASIVEASDLAAAPPVAVTKAKPREAEPALPQASVSLKVTPGKDGGPWTLKIENTGELPVRIAADAHLLSFELTPPAVTEADPKKKTAKAPAVLRCTLPDDARPSTDEGSDLVVPSKRSWSASFDPLFYCFGARERAALTAGTSVKARFGFGVSTQKAATTANPPFAITPVGAAVGKIGPAKYIESDTFALTETVSVTPPTSAAPASPDETSSGVSLTTSEALDASRGVELATTVTLHNNGDRPVTLLFRPDMLLFTVSSPAGNVSCGYPRQVGSPIRELFTTVGVKGRSDTSVLVTAVCPAGTFDEPGIYRVFPRIDTTGASGRALGLKTWEGQAAAKVPLLLRVRTAKKAAVPTRPSLD